MAWSPATRVGLMCRWHIAFVYLVYKNRMFISGQSGGVTEWSGWFPPGQDNQFDDTYFIICSLLYFLHHREMFNE